MSVPVVSTLEALLRPRARHDNDVSTWRDLDWARAGVDLPAGLELEWLGTAGFRLSYGGFDLLIEPYVSRQTLRAMLPKRALLSDAATLERFVPHADAVLVGHTHFDHAVDVPALARRDDCKVYGSTSLRTLMGLYGQVEHSVVAEPGRVYELGPFEVTFIESLHSKLALGLAVPMDGELTCDHLDGLSAGAYRSGQVYGIHIAVAGVTFYHQGSANLIDELVVHRGVDYFLAGIAGRGFTPHYAKRILSRLEPRIVIPQHFDDFFRPLDGEMGFSLNVNLGGFVEEVRRVSRDFEVRTLEPLRVVSGG